MAKKKHKGRSGSDNHFFGKHHSDETREHLSRVKMELVASGEITGKNSHRWNGGSWRYWRKQALIRDHFTCQKCRLYDPEIVVVDHIKPKAKHPHLSRVLSNLITLCPNDHARKTLEDVRNGLLDGAGRKKKI